MKKLLLIDGNSMIFRGYYATLYSSGNMSSKKGIPTNAVYGFSLMMNKALEMIQPDYMLVAFDTGKKTFRHKLYSEYKGGRKETPEDLIAQFAVVREMLDQMNIRRYEEEGIEADDIIGSLVNRYPDLDINILSSDHDLLQLIDPTTSVWLMKKGMSDIEKMDEKALFEQMQITPSQIIDLKGLMGDASDNIPGVPKVGEKTALKYLIQYGTVEGLYEHIDEVKGKIKENLIEFKDQALMSKKLATIFKEVDIPYELEDLKFEPDYFGLMKFYREYDFNSFIKKLEVKLSEINKSEDTLEDTNEYIEVTICPKELLHDHTFLYFDVDQDHIHANILGLALKDEKNCVYMQMENVLKDKELLKWLESEKIKVTYDIKKVRHQLEKTALTVKGLKEDVMILTFLCDSNCSSFEAMKEKFELSEHKTLEDVYGKGAKMKLPDLHEQIEFSCQRVNILYNLYQIAFPLIQEMKLESYYTDIEIPLCGILYEMEKTGVCVDEKTLDDLAKSLLEKIQRLSKEIFGYAEAEFNINSPKQLAEVLFDKLGLPSGKKRSTSADVLEKLMMLHPIIPCLLEYRKAQKLYSTYAEGLKKYIQEDGRIHTIYNQCLTQTGRLSSSDPNLQNISVRDEEGREIRKAFLPSENCVMLGCDYSQVELRVLAHMADEQGLIDAFKSGLDIHTKTAMDVFKIREEEVTSLARRQAKAVNFGIVYGISDFGLSEQLGISRSEAKRFIENYLESYPNISKYMDEQIEFCKEHGYVVTLLNRRREIKEIHDKNYMMREFGKRAAMNAPIQGTASDLIKLAMIKIDKEMKEKKLKSKMILQVHDELIFDVPIEEIDSMKDLISRNMENAMELNVPLVAECEQGNNWYEAK